MLFFLLALFSSVYSATWYQIENNQQLTGQTQKYYSYNAVGDSLREIKFSFSTTLAFASVSITTCYPVGTVVATGCTLATSCDLYVNTCNFVKGQTYFATVNLGVGALTPFNISVVESDVTVTSLANDGSGGTNVSTVFPKDGSQNSYAIFKYDVLANPTLNQFYIEANPSVAGGITIAYTNDPKTVCFNEADLPNSLYNRFAFSAYLENGASCSSKGAGPRYAYLSSSSATGWAKITPVDSSPSSTVINLGSNFYNWTNQSRPVGFYNFDVPVNSYATVSFVSPADISCRVSASKGNSPASNFGTCSPSLRTATFGLNNGNYDFGPCDSGLWQFSVVCTSVGGAANYNLEVDTTTTATSTFGYTSVAYGANSSHTGNSDVFLTFTNTATYTLNSGTPKQVVTLTYTENSGLSFTNQLSFSRSQVDPTNDLTTCAGIQTTNVLTAVGFTAVSWWPCNSEVTTGDLNLVISPQGGGILQDYTVTAVVQSAVSLGQNSSDSSATVRAAVNLYDVDLGNQDDLTILEITDTNSNQIYLQDVSTCAAPAATASYNGGTKVVAFCQAQNDNLVYYTRASTQNLVNNYTITSTVYPVPSTLRHQWTDRTQDFQLTLNQNFQVVDVSVANEAFTLDFTTISGVPAANIRIYQGCTLLDLGQFNYPATNQFQLLLSEETFSGTLRIAFSVGTLNLVTSPVINITYTGGLAASCAKFSVVGLFCGPVLDPATYYYCPSNDGNCGAAGGTVDSTARTLYNTVQQYFNQTISSECASVLNSYVCEPLYFKCDDNGAVQRNCNNQCSDIANKCGFNSCFDTSCNNAEYSTCSGNPPPFFIPGVIAPSAAPFSSASLLLLVLGLLSFLF